MSTKKPTKKVPKKSPAKKPKPTAMAAMIKAENAEPRATPEGVGMVFRGSLAALSGLIPTLSEPQLAQLDANLRPIQKAFEACHKQVKERLALAVKQLGKPFNENGSLEAHIPGYRLQSWKTPSRLDHSKVFALLGGKGIAPSVVGIPKPVEYTLDESNLSTLLAKGVISQEELDSCKTAERWVLQEPKPLTEVIE